MSCRCMCRSLFLGLGDMKYYIARDTELRLCTLIGDIFNMSIILPNELFPEIGITNSPTEVDIIIKDKGDTP